MRRMRRLFSALVLAGASWFIGTPAQADQPPAQSDQPPGQSDQPPGQSDQPAPSEQPPAQSGQPSAQSGQPSSQAPTTTMSRMSQKISTTATVEKMDAQKRQVTLRGADGNEFTVDVPESVKLGQIHEGDRLKIDYYQAVAISLKKPEAGAQSRTSETKITESNAGTLPGGMTARQITGTVEVVRIDRARNTLTVRRPNGAVDTINVTDPAMQAQLANLHEGDRIQATYTEAAAITVMREGATREGATKEGATRGGTPKS